MAWPLGFAYDERDQHPQSHQLPFVVEVQAPLLRVVLDPAMAVDGVPGRYFDRLRETPESGVAFLDISVDLDQPLSQGVWQLTRPHPDGGGYRVAHATYAWPVALRPHFDDFVERLVRERGVDKATAFQAFASLEVAQAAGAHLYVTEVEPIFGWRRDGVMFPCSPEDALAFIGLHQRLRGRPFLMREPLASFGVGPLPTIAVAALIPELGQLLQHQDPVRSEWGMAQSMLSSVVVRIERVLEDRDHLIARHLVAGRLLPYSSAEALVERIAMSLSGAFDALARAVNLALGWGVAPQQASFHRKDFRKKIANQSLRQAAGQPELQALLEVIGLLRNTIHHESLGAGSFIDARSGSSAEPVALVPAADGQRFMAASERLGVKGNWVPNLPGTVPSDIGVPVRALPAVEDMLHESVKQIRHLLQVTPWPDGQSLSKPPRPISPDLLDQASLLYGLPPRAS